MAQRVRETVLSRIKPPLDESNKAFTHLIKIGHNIEDALEKDAEILSDIRKKFDNLSAAVELEFEGTSVFDQEIKKTKELMEQSIAEVHRSLTVSNQIGTDLDIISHSFEKIHADGVLLEDIIKDINEVSDSIEVASRNAGITAYHAGRQGRGFEVIAREMTVLVKSVQYPTQQIPNVSDEIIRGMVDLGHSLDTVNNLIHSLQDTNAKFSRMTDELLGLIPNIETGIRDIGESVVSQKDLHQLLVAENERSQRWLDEIYDISRSSAVLEISLEALFRHVNNLRDSLFAINSDSSFVPTFNSLQYALEDALGRYKSIASEIATQDIGKLEIQSSERSILQLVTESNQLNTIIEHISKDIVSWLKANELACDILSNGTTLYKEIINNLSHLRKKLTSIQAISEKIAQPLHNLQKITERSKVLGLYAGIESARGGDYATSLGVVTKEIQDLSGKTMSFVGKIGEVSNDMVKSFSGLHDHLLKSIGDVEQGVKSLSAAVKILHENRTVLENLTHLSNEMMDSTHTMKTHCSALNSQMRALNSDYATIIDNYQGYSDAINQCTNASGQVQSIIQQYGHEVNILPSTRKTLIYRQTIEPILLDPANKTDARSHQVIEQIFIGLLTFDSANHLIPGVAESFSVSKDGCMWDFRLKPNIQFHDGEILTVAHILDMIDRVKRGPNVSFVDYVDRVIPIDELTVRFVLRFPYLPFLANLACGVCDITPSDYSLEKVNGAGPYRLVGWEKEKEIVLDANERFFNGRPPIDRVVTLFIPDNKEAIALFRRGEISLMQVTSDMVHDLRDYDLISGPALSTQYIHIHVTQDTPFSNKKVRQAVNYAIDKQAYSIHTYQSQAMVARGVFPPGMYCYNKDLIGYPYDLDKARSLMAEAGYPRGIDGIFVIDVRNDNIAIERAEYVKQSLEKIGINLEINAMAWKELLEKGYRGESTLCMKSWVSDNGDPDNFLFPLFHTRSFGRPGNTSFYSNTTVDTMIEQARSERNSKRRRELYQEVEQLIVDDAPWIFLTHGVDTYAVAQGIGGFKVDPFGIVRFRFLWSE